VAERVSIYIDGGNFYHLALKKIGCEEPDFDFDGFAKLVADGREIVPMGKRFYTGTVREREGDRKSVENMARQNRLFSSLIATQWELKTSKLRERVETLVIDGRVDQYKKLKKMGLSELKIRRNREKGIDVKIVTDLFIGAMDDKYDTAIIVSSDTDLVPAIDQVRHRMKKKVEYVGFSIEDAASPDNSTKTTLALMSRTDKQRVFVESDLKPFIKQKLAL
jgi:uncharacterized LabA/DUF88 family protein